MSRPPVERLVCGSSKDGAVLRHYGVGLCGFRPSVKVWREDRPESGVTIHREELPLLRRALASASTGQRDVTRIPLQGGGRFALEVLDVEVLAVDRETEAGVRAGRTLMLRAPELAWLREALQIAEWEAAS